MDHGLRDLEKEWRKGNGLQGSVAYLMALLRIGYVTRIECLLAWRICRLEWIAQGSNGDYVSSGTSFDPENPSMANDVLRVLFGEDPPIRNHVADNVLANFQRRGIL